MAEGIERRLLVVAEIEETVVGIAAFVDCGSCVRLYQVIWSRVLTAVVLLVHMIHRLVACIEHFGAVAERDLEPPDMLEELSTQLSGRYPWT